MDYNFNVDEETIEAVIKDLQASVDVVQKQNHTETD